MSPTRPNEETREAERREAEKRAGADREPTEDEARAAEAQGDLDGSVAEHEEEMMERGANQKGEGRIA